MRTSAYCFAAIAALALAACEDEPNALVDGGSSILTPDAAPAAGPDAAPALDAAPPGPDASSAGNDAAVSPATDAAASPPVHDAASDAAPPPADAGPKMCSAGTRLSPGSQSIQVMVGGLARSFTLHVPRSFTGTSAVPLVLDFHGLLLGADLYEVFSAWDDNLDQEGYLLAMPQGVDSAWNVGPCCTQSRTVDDVAFARAIVDKLHTMACVDERRIYATGFSNGGGMAFKLACDAADVFAAVAPAAFDLLEEMDCKPSRPLSVFIFRGSNDTIVPYAGGPSTPPTLYTLPEIHFLGATKTFERWAQLNGCTDTAADSGPGCKTHSACRAGVKVTLCTAQGGGHVALPVEVAWPMLKAFSKP